MTESQINPKELLLKAQRFAKQKNNGIPGRHREMLENMRDALSYLCSERMSVANIQEFISNQTGIKIGTAPLTRWLRENFAYPPVSNLTNRKNTDC